MPARTQITRHDCVEGWSCIGKWKGVPLAHVLDRAGLKPERALHRLPLRRYARQTRRHRALLREHRSRRRLHPQTILAYDMNGAS